MSRPSLSAFGYSQCSYTPANVTATGAGEEVFVFQTTFDGWNVKEYVGNDDDFLYYKFTAVSGADSFWAWPIEVDCSSTGSSKPATGTGNAAKIKQIQQKLNFYYQKHPNYPLTIDGSFGPKTCLAAYGFQQEATGYIGSNLIGEFFTKLGLPEVWTTGFKSSCASWYGDFQPTPGPTPPAPEPAPVSTPFPWMEVLVGAAGGGLIGLAGKKTVLKKTKLPTVAAGVGGAVLGALGGFVAGKMRQ
jgi:hypothetical protein